MRTAAAPQPNRNRRRYHARTHELASRSVPTDLDATRLAVHRELDRIANQVREHTLDQIRIGVHLGQFLYLDFRHPFRTLRQRELLLA